MREIIYEEAFFMLAQWLIYLDKIDMGQVQPQRLHTGHHVATGRAVGLELKIQLSIINIRM